MWDLYTERARKAIYYAQEEAKALGDNWLSGEHLLLGLLREDDNCAALLLKGVGCDTQQLCLNLKKKLRPRIFRRKENLTFNVQGKLVIQMAYEEAKRLGCNFIGPEHLLIGVARLGGGLANKALRSAGVRLEDIRILVLQMQESAHGIWPPAPKMDASVRENEPGHRACNSDFGDSAPAE